MVHSHEIATTCHRSKSTKFACMRIACMDIRIIQVLKYNNAMPSDLNAFLFCSVSHLPSSRNTTPLKAQTSKSVNPHSTTAPKVCSSILRFDWTKLTLRFHRLRQRTIFVASATMGCSSSKEKETLPPARRMPRAPSPYRSSSLRDRPRYEGGMTTAEYAEMVNERDLPPGRPLIGFQTKVRPGDTYRDFAHGYHYVS
jgi:hypothetical protein